MIDTTACELDIAWAAGLFEGEGSFNTTCPHKGRGLTKRYLRLTMQSCDLDVLERFQRIVGVGAIYAVRPDPRRPDAKRIWSWVASGERVFVEILGLFMPYLGKRRRERAVELLDSYGSGQLSLDALSDGIRS